jgi:hypothetical protein
MKYEIEIRFICGWGTHWIYQEHPNALPGPRGFIVGWFAKDIGFGELTVSFNDGKLKVDDEGMSREFCEAVMMKLVAGVVPTNSDEED